MRIAVFSDIHANPKALRRAIKSAKSIGCEQFICCGDIVGYGYGPNECIDICRENKIECVKGNHDAGLVGELSLDWFNETARRQILSNRPLVSDENRKWLENLPYSISKDIGTTKAVFCHGTYAFPERFDYIDDQFSAKMELDTMYRDGIDALFIGHTHEAIAYFMSDNNTYFRMELPKRMKERWNIRRESWMNAIINVGSVGYPRRHRFSTYAVIDADPVNVDWIRLPFELKNYSRSLLSAGMQVPVWVQGRISFNERKVAEDG